jgi:hypothetical protein
MRCTRSTGTWRETGTLRFFHLAELTQTVRCPLTWRLSTGTDTGLDPYGLRRTRVFSETSYYYTMIFVDLVLRFAWALKLSPHLEHYYDIEGGIFLLEVLEVFRRFLWVFFRVETEWIRARHTLPVAGGDSIALGELPIASGKIDED